MRELPRNSSRAPGSPSPILEHPAGKMAAGISGPASRWPRGPSVWGGRGSEMCEVGRRRPVCGTCACVGGRGTRAPSRGGAGGEPCQAGRVARMSHSVLHPPLIGLLVMGYVKLLALRQDLLNSRELSSTQVSGETFPSRSYTPR